jgi:hypothetical protein
LQWVIPQQSSDPNVAYRPPRFYWLENAARTDRAGDFVTATIPGGDVQYLARNVRRYSILNDSRLLVADNQAFRGLHNRLILIDMQKQAANYFIDAAFNFQFISSTELLADIVTGPDNFDVVRVPIPPAAP